MILSTRKKAEQLEMSWEEYWQVKKKKRENAWQTEMQVFARNKTVTQSKQK